MKMKRFMAVLLTLAMICPAFVLPSFADEETNGLDTEYEAKEMLLDYEFEEGETLPGSLLGSFSQETLESGEGTVCFYNAGGRSGFSLKNETEFLNSLKSALAADEVVMEFRYKADAENKGGNYNFFYPLFTYEKYFANEKNLPADLASGEWHKIAVKFDYKGNNPSYVKEIKIDGNKVDISEFTFSNINTIDKLVVSPDTFVLNTGFYANQGDKLWMDYLRFYKAESETVEPVIFEPEYEVKEMLLDYEFEEGGSMPEKGVSGSPKPVQQTLETGEGTAYFYQESTRCGFGFKENETFLNSLKSALATDEVVMEFRYKADAANINKNYNFFYPLFTYEKHFAKEKGLSPDLAIGEWHKIAVKFDYTGDAPSYVKEIKIDGNKVDISGFTLSNINTIDKLVMPDTSNLNTGFFINQGDKLWMDYLRFYKSEPETVEPVYLDTEYEAKDMLVDCEFETGSDIPGDVVNSTKPVQQTLESGEETAYFNSANGRIGFTLYGNADLKENLKAALNEGNVVYEMRYKYKGNGYKGFFSPLFVGRKDLNLAGENSVVLTEDEWHKTSVVLDYSSGSVDVKRWVIDGEEMSFNAQKLNAISNADSLFSEKFPQGLSVFMNREDNDSCEMWLDYLRVYTIDDIDDSLIMKRFEVAKRKNLSTYKNFDAAWLEAAQDDGTFSDLDYNDKAARATHLMRLKGMAAEYASSNREFSKNKTLLRKTLNGITYYINAQFDMVGTTGNWGNALEYPNVLAETLIILKNVGINVDSELLTKADYYFTICESETNNAKSFAYNVSNLPSTCAIWGSLAVLKGDISYIEKLYSALSDSLGNHSDGILDEGYEEIEGTMFKGDGLYPDGSYYGHGPLPYSFGYGNQFLNGNAAFIKLAAGTKYQHSAEKLSVPVSLVLDNMRWLLRGDNNEFTGLGRSISLASDGKVTNGYAQKLELYTEQLLAEPDIPRRAELSALLSELKTNTDKSYINGNKYFWLSDLMAHNRDKYSAVLNMSSKRTITSETLGDAGTKNYYMADGVTQIYVSGDEYENVIDAFDYSRLPGITAVSGEVPALSTVNNQNLGTSDFAGGVTNGAYGAAAMDIENKNGVSAKKAWFFFDDEMVALGTDIQSSSENDLYTNINQCALGGSVVYSKDGEKTLASESSENISGADWVYNGNIGYIVADGQNLVISNKSQSGASDGKARDVFSLYINHGANLQNKNYSYIVLPGATKEETAAYALDSAVEIAANNADVQAVYNKKLDMLQAIFRNPGELAFGEHKIKVDKACALIIKYKDSGAEIAVQNPYGKNVKITVSTPDKFSTDNNTYNAETGLSEISFITPNGMYSGNSVVKILSQAYFTDENGAEVKALAANAKININVEKALIKDDEFIMIAALTDKSGMLKKDYRFNLAKSDIEGDVLTKQIQLPENISEGDKLSVYIWSANGSLKPVLKAVTMTE